MSIQGKLRHYVNKAEQEFFRKIFTEKDSIDFMLDTYVAGGAVNSVMARRPINDIDVFFRSEEVAKRIVDRIIARMAGAHVGSLEVDEDLVNPELKRGSLSDGVVEAINKKIRIHGQNGSYEGIKFASHNAITLDTGLQIIFRFIGQPQVVFTTFDYDHCKVWFDRSPLDPLSGRVTITPEAAEAIARNELIYRQNSRFILAALSRMNKFVGRGWVCPSETLVSIALSLKSIDLEDPLVFKEELQGLYGIRPEHVSYLLHNAEENGRINIKKALLLLGDI